MVLVAKTVVAESRLEPTALHDLMRPVLKQFSANRSIEFQLQLHLDDLSLILWQSETMSQPWTCLAPNNIKDKPTASSKREKDRRNQRELSGQRRGVHELVIETISLWKPNLNMSVEKKGWVCNVFKDMCNCILWFGGIQLVGWWSGEVNSFFCSFSIMEGSHESFGKQTLLRSGQNGPCLCVGETEQSKFHWVNLFTFLPLFQF